MIQQSLENALRKAGNTRRRGDDHHAGRGRCRRSRAEGSDEVHRPRTVGRARQGAAGRGTPGKDGCEGHFRRVVGSPSPIAIHELTTIRSLIERDTVVIACGGGGVPVYEDPALGLEGVDASSTRISRPRCSRATSAPSCC